MEKVCVFLENIKFEISPKSGKVTARADTVLEKNEHGETVNKCISKSKGEGFTMSEAFSNMLDSINVKDM